MAHESFSMDGHVKYLYIIRIDYVGVALNTCSARKGKGNKNSQQVEFCTCGLTRLVELRLRYTLHKFNDRCRKGRKMV